MRWRDRVRFVVGSVLVRAGVRVMGRDVIDLARAKAAAEPEAPTAPGVVVIETPRAREMRERGEIAASRRQPRERPEDAPLAGSAAARLAAIVGR